MVVGFDIENGGGQSHKTRMRADLSSDVQF